MTPSAQSPGDRAVDRAFASFVERRDPDALAEVFDRTAHRLTLVAARLVGGDAHAAEDVVQATFLEAIRSADRFRPGAAVMPWLLGILTHQAARVRRRRTVAPSDPAAPELASALSDDPEPGALAADRDLAERIEAAVRGLDAPYREVLALRLLHGLRPTDIATALDRPLGTVRAQLHRGLERLRRVLPAGIAGVVLTAFGGDALAQVRATVLREAGRVAVPTGAGVGATTLFSLGALMTAKTLSWFVAGAAGLAALILLWPSPAPIPGAPLAAGDGGGVGLRVAPPLDEAEQSLGVNRQAVAVEPDGPLPLAPGDVRFQGRVVARESGLPIAGAQIRVTAYALGRNRVEDHWSAPEPVRSDADGRFLLDVANPDEVALEVWVSAEGRVAMGGGHSDLRSDVEVDLGELPLASAAEVVLRLVDPDGRGLEGYEVWAVADDYGERRDVLDMSDQIGWSQSAVTDPSGRLAPATQAVGGYRLTEVFSPGSGVPLPTSATPRAFEVRASEQVQTITITLPAADPATSAFGRVVTAAGEPVGGLEVGFHLPEGGYHPRWTHADGRLEARGLPAEVALRIDVVDREAWTLVRPTESVRAGTRDLEIVVEPIPARRVELRLREADGGAVDAELVMVQRHYEGQAPGESWWGGVDPFDGEHWHRRSEAGVWELALHDGLHRVIAVRRDDPLHPTVMCELEVHADASVDWVLPELRDWTVRIVGTDARPVSGVRVALRSSVNPRFGRTLFHLPVGPEPDRSTSHIERSRGVTDRDGEVTFRTPVDLGDSAVAVSGPGLVGEVVECPRLPEGGVREIRVAGAGIVRGRVEPLEILERLAEPDQDFTMRRQLLRDTSEVRAVVVLTSMEGDEIIRCDVDGEGRASFESVPAGVWTATLHGLHGFAPQPAEGGPIRVEEGEVAEVRFELAALRPGRARVRIEPHPGLNGPADLLLSGAAQLVHRGAPTDGSWFEIAPLAPGRYSAELHWSGRVADRWRSVTYRVAPLPTVVPGQSSDWVVRPEAEGGVRLVVVDAGGDPVANRGVCCFDPSVLSPRRWFRGTTDSEGRLELDPAPGLRFGLRVARSVEENPAEAPTVATVDVDPNARWTERRVVLPD